MGPVACHSPTEIAMEAFQTVHKVSDPNKAYPLDLPEVHGYIHMVDDTLIEQAGHILHKGFSFDNNKDRGTYAHTSFFRIHNYCMQLPLQCAIIYATAHSDMKSLLYKNQGNTPWRN